MNRTKTPSEPPRRLRVRTVTVMAPPMVEPAPPGRVPDEGDSGPLGPLPIDDPGWIRRGSRESPFDYDRRWRDHVYRGDVPQLTARAVITGMLIGATLAISNLYVGLKVGWSLGVAITACVLSVAAWRTFARTGLIGSQPSLLEQNCMQSTASAAGFTSVAAMVTAVPAYMMVTGLRIAPVWLVLWTFFTSMLGLFLMVPLKRQLLHYERLAWPSSVAAAQTLRTLHAEGTRAASQARRFFMAAGISAAIRFAIGNTFAWWRLPHWPTTLELPGRLFGHPLAAYTIGMDGSAFYYAAGAILGVRISTWMLVGSAAVWLGFAPWLVQSGRIGEPGYGPVMMAGALWAAASMMISASLTSLVMQWRVLVRGVSGLRKLARAQGPRQEDPLTHVEVPASWWIGGVAICSVAVVLVGERGFGIAWPLGLFGIAASAAIVSVAIRATGETDITPAGPLGKLVQLGYGLIAPRAVAGNLLGTSIVTTSAATAADAAINLKCGHLLGAHPRQQFLAQAFGVVAGTAVVVPAFALLVPNAAAMGSASLPAPAAASWRVVAEVVSGGLGALDTLAIACLVVGSVLGVVLTLGDRWGESLPRWWPSPVGLGVGMILGFSESATFLAGALIASLVLRRWREDGDDRVLSLASGSIAGDSLMGVLLALLVSLGWMRA